MKIILVDDEELIRQGIEKILSRFELPIEVIGSFPNGLTALTEMERLEGGQPNVVITDIRMPLMDGLKFIEKLRGKLPDVAIIVLSGFNEFDYARQAMRYGVHDYFLKPIDKYELFETLKKISHSNPQTPFQHRTEQVERSEHHVAEEIKHILEKEYNRNVEMDSLANRIGYSISYIGKHFKQETGMTITDFLINLRIQKAKQFIDDYPNLKMYEVAQLVGYPDPVYFNKLFKKMVSLTPKEYKVRNEWLSGG